MALSLPLYNPTVKDVAPPQPGTDFVDSALKGYQLGRVIKGIPQQADALKIAQVQQDLNQSAQEFPTRLALVNEQVKNQPFIRAKSIGDILESPGTVSGQEQPSDTVPLSLPGYEGIGVSPSQAQSYLKMKLTSPFEKIMMNDVLMRQRAQEAEARRAERGIPVWAINPTTKEEQLQYVRPGSSLPEGWQKSPNYTAQVTEDGSIVVVPTSGPTVGKATKVTTGEGEPIKGTVPNKLPAEQILNLESIGELKSLSSDIKSLYKPEYTGMLDSVTAKIKQKTGFGATPELAQFRQKVSELQNRLLYLYSGKQINEQEFKRLSATLPDMTQSDVDFLAKLDSFDKELDKFETLRKGALSGAGYRIPGEATSETTSRPRFTIREKK